MSFSTDATMPSYFICRDIPVGQPFDLTAPLVFCPPKDSDELFDALRSKYPHLRTHSERTRQAVIEYLIEETQFPQISIEPLSTPQTTTSVNVSPWEASMQSMSSDSSTWSSPEMFGLATPSFGMSPQPQHQTLASEQPLSTITLCPTQTTPQPLEQMTGVFSLSDSAQPKQRMRRKMTEAEKAEYRKRRIVKACDKCAKRKRKCNHNQPEMESVASKTNKIAKSNPNSQLRLPVQKQPQQQHFATVINGMSIFDQSLDPDVSMPSFDDFTILPEDPMLSIDTAQWPWSDTPDWALLDPMMSTTESLHNTQTVESETKVVGCDMGLMTRGYDGDMPWQQPFGQMEQPQTRQQPTHTHHLHESYSSHGSSVLELNNSLDTILDGHQHQQWIRSDLQPSNSICERQESHNAANTMGGNGRYPSLADTTLRLIATRKAVKAFGNLLPSKSPHRSRLQTVSLQKVALLTLGGLSVAQSLAVSVGASQDATIATNSSSDVSSGRIISQPDGNRQSGRHNNSRTSSGDDGDIPMPTPQSSPRYHQVKTHARSLGEGIAILKSPTTELYMLKRRLPNSQLSEMSRASAPLNPLLMAVPNATALQESGQETATTRCPIPAHGNSTTGIQTNGGAYPRLASSPSIDVAANHHTGATAPAHTRPHDSSTCGFEGTSDLVTRFSHSGPSSSGGWFKNAQGNGLANTSQAGSAAAVEKSAYRTPTQNQVVAYRLSDHFRRRDHFGRSVSAGCMGALAAIAALGSLLLLLSLVPTETTTTASSLTLMLLALVHPLPSSLDRINTAGTPFAAQLWGTDAQWNLWNSAWGKLKSSGRPVKVLGRLPLQTMKGFLSRGRKIGDRGRISSIGKNAI